jgi:hypothetical protein
MRRFSMSKLMSIVLASAVALLCAASFAGASGTGTTKQGKSTGKQGTGTSKQRKVVPTVIPVLGPVVKVPVGKFVQAFAYCPRGYYASGGGEYNGAITEIASSPTRDLRGWFVDGTNNDPLGRTFQHRAVAVCVKGVAAPWALSAAASGARLVHQAELEFASRYSRTQ